MPIITCCNREFNIPYNDDINSVYIKDVVKSFDNVDVNIRIPDKYCIVIDNYVEYIRGNGIPCTRRDRLLLCFLLNTLFIDDVYFKHLIQQVFSAAHLIVQPSVRTNLRFNNWSYMCNMVYDDFNDDLQWSFFVYSPYDFISKHLLDNVLFMTQWGKINQNVIIKVNHDDEVYYNNVEAINKNGQKITKIYHIVNNKKDVSYAKETGYRRETLYYDISGNIKSKKLQ